MHLLVFSMSGCTQKHEATGNHTIKKAGIGTPLGEDNRIKLRRMAEERLELAIWEHSEALEANNALKEPLRGIAGEIDALEESIPRCESAYDHFAQSVKVRKTFVNEWRIKHPGKNISEKITKLLEEGNSTLEKLNLHILEKIADLEENKSKMHKMMDAYSISRARVYDLKLRIDQLQDELKNESLWAALEAALGASSTLEEHIAKADEFINDLRGISGTKRFRHAFEEGEWTLVANDPDLANEWEVSLRQHEAVETTGERGRETSTKEKFPTLVLPGLLTAEDLEDSDTSPDDATYGDDAVPRKRSSLSVGDFDDIVDEVEIEDGEVVRHGPELGLTGL